MNEEQRIRRNKSNITSRLKSQKQIPLSYKKEIAEIIYNHAADMGTTPITWIKQAIANQYKHDTGKDLQ